MAQEPIPPSQGSETFKAPKHEIILYFIKAALDISLPVIISGLLKPKNRIHQLFHQKITSDTLSINFRFNRMSVYRHLASNCIYH